MSSFSNLSKDRTDEAHFFMLYAYTMSHSGNVNTQAALYLVFCVHILTSKLHS